MSTTRREAIIAGACGIGAAAVAASAAEPARSGEAAGHRSRDGANTVAILNDTHIGESHADGHTHPENLRMAVRQILSLETRPAAVIVNGDLAMWAGTPGDYRRFVDLIEPLRAELPVHFTLGNHDVRDEFLRGVPAIDSVSRLQDHRHNGLVDLPHARLVLLDSLKDTPAAPGRLGGEQIEWLIAQADTDKVKPLAVFSHHNPRVGGDAAHFPGGIEDTDAFWPDLVSRPQVKAFIHGHVHDWTLGMHSGIHVINTPASALLADKRVSANGWTLATFAPAGVNLEIHTYQADHPWNGERKWLFWRQPRG